MRGRFDLIIIMHCEHKTAQGNMQDDSEQIICFRPKQNDPGVKTPQLFCHISGNALGTKLDIICVHKYLVWSGCHKALAGLQSYLVMFQKESCYEEENKLLESSKDTTIIFLGESPKG